MKIYKIIQSKNCPDGILETEVFKTYNKNKAEIIKAFFEHESLSDSNYHIICDDVLYYT